MAAKKSPRKPSKAKAKSQPGKAPAKKTPPKSGYKAKVITPSMAIRIERYAQARAQGNNQTDSYRMAVPNAKQWKDNTVHTRASEMEGKAQVRIAELKAEAKTRHDVTVDSLCQEFNENREFARILAKPEAMNTATMGKAKLHGLARDKVDHTHDVGEVLRDFFGKHLPKSTGLPNEDAS